MRGRYFVHQVIYTDKIVHWDLDGRTPVGSFGDKWVGISRRSTCICKFWKSQTIKFQLTEPKTKVSDFRTIHKLKLVVWHIDEKMPPVAEEKNLIQRSVITVKKSLGDFGSSRFLRKSENEDLGFDSFCPKTTSCFDIIKKKSWQLLLWGKTNLNIMTNQTNIQFLASLAH